MKLSYKIINNLKYDLAVMIDKYMFGQVIKYLK